MANHDPKETLPPPPPPEPPPLPPGLEPHAGARLPTEPAPPPEAPATLSTEEEARARLVAREEVRVLKEELRATVARARTPRGRGTGQLFGAAACLLVLAGLAFLAALIGLVATGLPGWLASLLVACFLAIAGLVLLLVGGARLRGGRGATASTGA